jgi:hypothetical protein
MSWLEEKLGEARDFVSDPSVIVAVAIAYVTGGVSAGFEGGAYVGFNWGAAATSAVTTASLTAASRALTPPIDELGGTGIGDLAERGTNFQFRSPAAAREVVYGEVRKSGVITNIETTNNTFVAGSGNEYLWMTIAIAFTPVQQITVYFNNTSINSPSQRANQFFDAFNSNNPFYGYVGLMGNLGFESDYTSVGNAASPGGDGVVFRACHPYAASDTNESDDLYYARLAQTAYVACRLRYNATVYSEGIPNISFKVKGRKTQVFLDGSTAYSSNPADNIKDYLMNTTFGAGIPASEIDAASFASARGYCGSAIVRDGVASPRFSCNGIVDTSKTIKANIEDMLSCCAGQLVYVNGKFKLLVAQYSTPTKTLTNDDFLGAVRISTKTPMRDQINEVKAIYFDEQNLQVSDAPVVVYDPQAEDNGFRKSIDISLPFTTSKEEAKHLAFITMNESRFQLTINVKCKLTAFDLEVGDTVYVTDTTLGFNQKIFKVMGWRLDTDANGLSVDLTLKETASDIYDYKLSAPTTRVVVTHQDELGFAAGGERNAYQYPNKTHIKGLFSSVDYDNDGVTENAWADANVEKVWVLESYDRISGDYHDGNTADADNSALVIGDGLAGKLRIVNKGSIVGVRHANTVNYNDGAHKIAGHAILIENNPTATITIVNEGEILGAGGRGGNGGDGGTAIATDGSTLSGGTHGSFSRGGRGAGYKALNDATLPAFDDDPVNGSTTIVYGQIDPQDANIKGGQTGTNGAGGDFGQPGQDGGQGTAGVSPFGFTQGSAGQSGGQPGKAIKDNSNGATIIVSNRGTIAGEMEGVS